MKVQDCPPEWQKNFTRLPSCWDEVLIEYSGFGRLSYIFRASKQGTWGYAEITPNRGEAPFIDFEKCAPSFAELVEILPVHLRREWGVEYIWNEDAVEEALREIHSSED